MPLNIRAQCRYDGTDFSGWQVQPGQRTVQGAIEGALAKIAGTDVRIAGAGRTDSGVHALEQVFSASLPDNVAIENLVRSLSKMLAPDIRIESLEPAEEEFHASYSSTGKRYAYVFYSGRSPDPFGTRYSWSLPWEIDRDLLRELIDCVTGEHDFAGFCSSGSSVKTTVRTIHSLEMRSGPMVGPADSGDFWHLEFQGSGFLYKMVRNITGTLIDIARGHTPRGRLDELLDAPAPYLGFTAPAQGLFLKEVLY